ncbi:MAG: hypothetical protein LBI69_00880 [Puniceicoccales bacterium]|jgi:hypothetical protein|nr:hypothetical protein [Puniceicoccales bacterium]
MGDNSMSDPLIANTNGQPQSIAGSNNSLPENGIDPTDSTILTAETPTLSPSSSQLNIWEAMDANDLSQFLLKADISDAINIALQISEEKSEEIFKLMYLADGAKTFEIICGVGESYLYYKDVRVLSILTAVPMSLDDRKNILLDNNVCMKMKILLLKASMSMEETTEGMNALCVAIGANELAKLTVAMFANSIKDVGCKIISTICNQQDNDGITYVANFLTAMWPGLQKSNGSDIIEIMYIIQNKLRNNESMTKLFTKMKKETVLGFFMKFMHSSSGDVKYAQLFKILAHTLCVMEASNEEIGEFFKGVLEFKRPIPVKSNRKDDANSIGMRLFFTVASENMDLAESALQKLDNETVKKLFVRGAEFSPIAFNLFGKIYSSSGEESKRAIEIFREIVNSCQLTHVALFLREIDEANHSKALAILNDGIIPECNVISILKSDLVREAMVCDFLDGLYLLNKQKATEMFEKILSPSKGRNVTKTIPRNREVNTSNNSLSDRRAMQGNGKAKRSEIIISRDRLSVIFLKIDALDSEIALEILSKLYKEMALCTIGQILTGKAMAISNAIIFFKKLYQLDANKAIKALFYDNYDRIQGNRAFGILSKMYDDETDNPIVLEILLEMNSSTTVDFLASNLIDDGKAIEIFKNLYAKNLEHNRDCKKVVCIWSDMLSANKSPDRATRILVNLYDDSSNHEMALKILFNSSPESSGCFLANGLMTEGKAIEVFKEFYAKDYRMATDALIMIASWRFDSSKRSPVIFLEMAKNREDAAKILLEGFASCEILANAYVSFQNMANILTMIYSPNRVNEIVHLLVEMTRVPESKSHEKIAKALAQMDQDTADLLLKGMASKQCKGIEEIQLNVEKIRSQCIEPDQELELAMQHHDAEFIIRFQSSTAAVEQTENQSDNVSQSVTVDKEQIVSISSDGISPKTNVLDEETPTVENKIFNGEIPSEKEVYVDKILSTKSDTPALSHPGWLGKIFMGTVGKVLAAVAIIAGSGLALWAVILWPLAACIGAGCAAVALAAAIFYQGRSANHVKSTQVNLPPSEGNGLSEVVDLQDICI